MRKTKMPTLFWALLLFVTTVYSDDLFLGIIEQHFDNWNIDSIRPFVIRVAFTKTKTGWKPMPCDFGNNPNAYIPVFPKKLDWNICFDGKQIGQLHSAIPQTINFYKDIGIHFIEEINEVPKIGKPSEKFSGWMGTNVYRPVIVSTLPYCSDTSKLKPYKPTNQDISKAISVARKLSAKYSSFQKLEKYNIEKSYSSSISKLICISFKNDNAIPADTSDFSEEKTGNSQFAWFCIENEKCHYLKSNMLLIDAGDYDNNGEIDFQI